MASMQGRPSAFAAVALWALVVGLGACSDRTAIMVEVTSADLSIPADIDSITIRAESRFGSTHEATYPVATSWPHSLTILPAPREGIGEVRIDVTGNLAGSFVVRRVVFSEFVPGTLRRVTVVLSRDCVGVVCGVGIDCVSPGRCVDTSPDGGLPDGGPADGGSGDAGLDTLELDASTPIDAPIGIDAGLDAPVTGDAGVDAPTPLDAGPPDAGPPDAGPSDAGPPDAGPPDAPPIDAGPGPGPIFFSEYVEGSSNNKALEIFNSGTTALDLSTCDINLYSNGSSSPTPYTGLVGALAGGDVFVLCHGSAGVTLAPLCDQLGPAGGAMAFNGNDAIALVCGGTTRDVIGQIGFDPGVEWGAGATSTGDATLRRSCAVTSGDTIGTDAFDPALQWTGSPVDTFSGLGLRGCP